MDKGALFCIESDRIASHSDIPAWCHFTGNKLLKAEKGSGIYRFYVEKMAKKGKVAVKDEQEDIISRG